MAGLRHGSWLHHPVLNYRLGGRRALPNQRLQRVLGNVGGLMTGQSRLWVDVCEHLLCDPCGIRDHPR